MKKTLKELINMIDNGTLNTEHSTQRQFLYANEQTILESGEITTKAGAVINSILELKIQLPAIYFFYNTDTNTTNLHDGKQRVLSAYYFIKPNQYCSVSTIINGENYSNFNALDQEMQDRLMNYEFDIVERSGTTAEEETSFKLINKSGMPLTDYEIVKGMFFGPFLTQFENYVEGVSKRLDNIKEIARGAQAYNILLNIFQITLDHNSLVKSRAFDELKARLRQVRNNNFDAAAYKADIFLTKFNELMSISCKKLFKEERAMNIISYCLKNNYNLDRVIDSFRVAARRENDMGAWDMQTLKTYIDALIKKNKILCATRFFSKEIKDELYRTYGRCQHVDEYGRQCNVTSYSALEVDHIIPWAEGGQTNIRNAQLLCKSHNVSKGKKLN